MTQAASLDYQAINALVTDPKRYFFFTGKGGVGKTSLASATALALAESGKRTLLISTDPASNLDEVLGLELTPSPQIVSPTDHLYALNIDPEAVAAAYRERVISPLRGLLPESALKQMEEQLSGACTLEIASFDEFTSYLSGDQHTAFDHIIFDTAPTGHTLRLMALSQAWTHFFDENTSGNSCLGPLAGLQKQRELYAHAVAVLQDPAQTSVVLVIRAQKSALKEAERTCVELRALGIENQSLALNGWFEPLHPEDTIAQAWLQRQQDALTDAANFLNSLPRYRTRLLPTNLIGLDALRALYAKDVGGSENLDTVSDTTTPQSSLPCLATLADELASRDHGVILTMGKGGVGKTTLAAALALALAERGAQVTLSTTDPAAHLSHALADANDAVQLERIDPKTETQAYVAEVLAQQGDTLDAASRALLEEDLRSPCTEEIAVFRAFARTIAQGQDRWVVLDTAPTGHTLLLLDATQSYHRELERQSRSLQRTESVTQLLPRLRDSNFTYVLITTLPEATPVHESSALQADLIRAGITPYAWIINQSLSGLETTEPVLHARQHGEQRYVAEAVAQAPEGKAYQVCWQPKEPSGRDALHSLLY